MTIKIEIYGDNLFDVLKQLQSFSANAGNAEATEAVAPIPAPARVAEVVAEVVEKKPAKEKKAKEEKVSEPTAEVLAPEKTKYVLQDVINRAIGAAGKKGESGHEETILQLQKLNIKFGVAKVSEIPADKIDGYMAEMDKVFPAKAEVITSGNIF